jgi:hypothetical protein
LARAVSFAEAVRDCSRESFDCMGIESARSLPLAKA